MKYTHQFVKQIKQFFINQYSCGFTIKWFLNIFYFWYNSVVLPLIWRYSRPYYKDSLEMKKYGWYQLHELYAIFAGLNDETQQRSLCLYQCHEDETE